MFSRKEKGPELTIVPDPQKEKKIDEEKDGYVEATKLDQIKGEPIFIATLSDHDGVGKFTQPMTAEGLFEMVKWGLKFYAPGSEGIVEGQPKNGNIKDFPKKNDTSGTSGDAA